MIGEHVSCQMELTRMEGGRLAPHGRSSQCRIVLVNVSLCRFAGVLQTATMKIVVKCYGSGCVPGLGAVVGAAPCRDGAGERCRRVTARVCGLRPAQSFRPRDGAGDLCYSEG